MIRSIVGACTLLVAAAFAAAEAAHGFGDGGLAFAA